MQQQDPQIQELADKLVQAQSRSFEMISNLTGERDEARVATQRLDNVLKLIVSSLGMEGPTIDSLVAEINRLVTLDKVGKENTIGKNDKK